MDNDFYLHFLDVRLMLDASVANRQFQSETQMAQLLVNMVTLCTKLHILWGSFTNTVDRTAISTSLFTGAILKAVSTQALSESQNKFASL